MRIKALLLGLLMASLAGAAGTPDQFAWQITNFPLYGGVVAQSDTVNLSRPTAIRVDADGAVTAACVGNGGDDEITLNLVAGEFFPCQVIRVYDTGTDAITIHGFY